MYYNSMAHTCYHAAYAPRLTHIDKAFSPTESLRQSIKIFFVVKVAVYIALESFTRLNEKVTKFLFSLFVNWYFQDFSFSRTTRVVQPALLYFTLVSRFSIFFFLQRFSTVCTTKILR